ncbi:MAG: hydantoinase/oxoprolinase family protein [Planctomycetes bacterium]|nr:hydantoinase/oxoprolinase family protein [Planctomycetota bacterium]
MSSNGLARRRHRWDDFVLVDGDRITVRKLPSTKDDPGRVIIEAIDALALDRAGSTVVHGSTVATNAILEDRVARTVLVTTQGFGDVLEIGRQDRSRIYAFEDQRPKPLVPADLRVEVRERIGPGGVVVEPLTDEEVRRVLETVRAIDPEAVVVGCLFATENDLHERRLVEALSSLDVPVIASHDVLPETREYERFSTAVMSGAVAPIMERYLGKLSAGIAPAPLFVMESGGGVFPAEQIRGRAVRTVLSGPAGGVVAARTLARSHDRDLVTFDMGGTSTDVCLVPRSGWTRTHRMTIRELPIGIPVVDVHTVGAGGGSRAWIDAGLALRVGPQSSGARPGPICYGHGGTVATVTDAHVFLGRLPADSKLGGELALSVETLDEAFRELGARIGVSAHAAAAGVIQVVEAEMARALRRITQERGIDPRELALLPFGGAGGLHAVSLAQELGMREVIVPRDPGVFCALGMLIAPVVESAAATVLALLDDTLLESLRERIIELEQPGRRRLEALSRARGGESNAVDTHRELSMRFLGQSHELDIRWLAEDASAVRRRFFEAYRVRYGSVDDTRPVELTAVRSRLELLSPLGRDERAAAALIATRAAADQPANEGSDRVPVWSSRGERSEVERRWRGSLSPGEEGRGPVIISELSSTTWVPEGTRYRVAPDGCLILSPETGRAT